MDDKKKKKDILKEVDLPATHFTNRKMSKLQEGFAEMEDVDSPARMEAAPQAEKTEASEKIETAEKVVQAGDTTQPGQTAQASGVTAADQAAQGAQVAQTEQAAAQTNGTPQTTGTPTLEKPAQTGVAAEADRVVKAGMRANIELCDDGITPITDDLFVLAEHDSSDAERIGYSNYSYWRSTFHVFFKKKSSVFLLCFLCVLLLFTFIQPFLPNQKDPYLIYNDEAGSLLRNVSPNSEFWFGTNSIGQDLWSRLWSGTRTSLFIGLCVAVCNVVVGMILGSIWGYARKWDWLFTEIYNLFDNIPYTILRMLLMYILHPSLTTMIFVMCLTGWVGMTKYIRNQILIYRDREFNLASRCLGTPGPKIILRNILPQLISVIMLQTALSIPDAIGSEVFLTYIGLGLPVSIPSLGNLINEGRKVMLVPSQRYQLFFPVLIVSAITISFYALGNAFADASDPRNHR